MDYLGQHLVGASAKRGRHAAPTVGRLLPLIAWLSLLVIAIAMLVLMGRGGLGTPSVLEPSAWPAWASGRDPLEVAFAVLRLAGLGVAWYLLGATTIGMVARLLRWTRLVDVADVLTVPWVRRLLQGALGLGLATAAMTSATMGSMAAPGSAVGGRQLDVGAVLAATVAFGDPEATTETMPPAPSAAAIEPARSVPPAGGVEAPRPAPPAVAVAPAPAPAPAPEPTGWWKVQPGEHLWSIAEAILAQAWGRAPSDAELVPYWQQLIAANQSGLVDPGNPDLILPGQMLTVPPSPPPG